jgi:hypothetical protein
LEMITRNAIAHWQSFVVKAAISLVQDVTGPSVGGGTCGRRPRGAQENLALRTLALGPHFHRSRRQ